MTTGPSPDVPRLVPFRVGDWLVEPKACRLSHGNTAVKLRPQLVDVLVCLARRAGDIVLKDEILAEVWPGQYVAESGLSRCVAELRQQLGDDAHVPRYIETIPKRGYRLVAPVTWLPAPEAAPAVSGPAIAPPAAEADPPMPPADAPLGPVAAEAAAGDGAVKAPRRGWRQMSLTNRFAVAGGVLIAVVALTITGVLNAGGWVGRALINERDTVLLADVTNTTGNAVFDDALRLALSVNLGQAPFLRILPREAVRGAMGRAGRSPDGRVTGAVALDVCRREGAAVLLATSIASLGSRYAVGIEAVACESGEEVWRTIEEADRKERVLDALDRAATRTRRRLGESRESLRQHDVPLVRATTPSLDALKALTLGDESRDHGRLDDALVFYRQATELDPDFALAWARRGAVARNLGLGDEMTPAYGRAYALRGRVSQPERFYIEAHYVVDADPEKAIEVFRSWKRMYPGSYIPPNNLAALLSGQMGQYDEALEEAREAVRLAPGSAIAHRTLVQVYLGLGRLEEARQASAVAAPRGIDELHGHRLALKVLLLDGSRAALEQKWHSESGDPMARLDTLRLRASAAMAAGRLREARRLWSDALERAPGIGLAGRVVEIRLDQAEAEALLGDPRTAREAVQAALALDPNPVTRTTSATVLALAGDPVRARAILDDIARQPVPAPGALRVSLPAARALVEAVQGHPDEAIGIWQSIARFARGSDFALVPLGIGALVELHAHRPLDSAAAFKDLIQLRALEPASCWVAFARLGLARALRAAGDKAGSAAAYAAFLDAWKNADTDAPLLIAARREHAAATR